MFRLNIVKYTVRPLLFLTLFFISLSTSAIAQENNSTEPAAENSNPSSVFSIDGGKKLMQEADQAIDNQDYELAGQKLQSARQVFNQLSNFYLQLYNGTSQLDNVAADSHRKKALETGVARDEATYQLALVHRSQNKPELSIPLLIQIINSQSPGIGLGKKAYDQLLEIGFVDVPITIPKAGSNPPAENPQAAPDTQPPANPQVPPTVQPGTNPQVPPTVQPTVPNP